MWRILVVDDVAMIRKLIIRTLRDKAECEIATNGKEALERYDESIANGTAYDLMLLDVAMPEMDGIEVLKTVREKEAARGIVIGHGMPIIMVTAYKEPFFDAFNQGCDDYLLKPVEGETLLRKIEEKLG